MKRSALHTIWHRIHLQLQLIRHFIVNYVSLIYGVWKIAELQKPIVTIFGGSHMKQEDYFAQQAKALGTLLVDNNMSLITGGGPGIMEAANCGANSSSLRPQGIRSIGIAVQGLKDQPNNCADTTIVVEQFAVRKWLLIHYAAAFVVFPGGFGTLDELFEVITLIETNFLEQTPVILFGSSYWKPIIEWQETAQSMGLILQHERKLLFVTDDIQEACTFIKKYMACPLENHW